MTNYKNLNPVSRKSFKRRLEFESSGLSHIQDAVMKTLYEEEVDLTGEFYGVVLSRLGEPTTFLDVGKSATLGSLGFDLDSQFYKIRVNPVHNMIPMPESADDCIAINMHHTFSQLIESLSHKDLEVGDIVVVSFIDGSGIFNPKVLRKTGSRETSVVEWSKKVSPEAASQVKSDSAQITKPPGDKVGSGVKCVNNQVPKVFSKVDESQYSSDNVLRWLPIIRGARKEIEEKANIDISYINDSLILALIDVESKGKTGLNFDTSIRKNKSGEKSRSQFYGILQQRDDYIHFAYDWGPGRAVLGSPFAASNLINFSDHPNKSEGTKIHQTVSKDANASRKKAQQKVIDDIKAAPVKEFSNFEEAGSMAILVSMLHFHRGVDRHERIPDLIASYHNGGGSTASKIKERARADGSTYLEAAKNLKKEGALTAAPNNDKYIEDFLREYNKYKQKLGEYNPEAANVTKEDCEEKEEFVGPIQPENNVGPNITLDQLIISHGIKHFRAPELLSREERGGPKIIEPPQESWPRILSTLELADEIREILGAPLRVESGYRTSQYNQIVGGATASEHVEFRALDLAWDGPIEELWRVAEEVMNRASSRGIRTGLGKYNTFVHIDTGSTKSAHRRWNG